MKQKVFIEINMLLKEMKKKKKKWEIYDNHRDLTIGFRTLDRKLWFIISLSNYGKSKSRIKDSTVILFTTTSGREKIAEEYSV